MVFSLNMAILNCDLKKFRDVNNVPTFASQANFVRLAEFLADLI